MASRLKKYINGLQKPRKVLTLDQVLRPFYRVISFIGLFPYNIKYQDNNFVIVYKSIYINALSAVTINLIISLFVALHIQNIYTSIEDNSMAIGIMPHVNYITELLCLVLFCFVTYISAFLNRYNYVRMVNTLAKILEVSCNSEKVLGRLKIEIKFLILGILLFVFLLQIAINFSRDDSFYKMILVFFTFNVSQTIQFISIAFYCILIDIIVATLITVRLRLNSMIKEKPFRKEYIMTVQSKLPPVSLRQMEIVYRKALRIKREVNNAFQASILVTMLQCFHSMVSESHIIYHGVIVEKSLTTHEILNCGIWIVYQLGKVGALANSGRLLKNEIMLLSQTLYSLPTEKNDINSFMEVQHFSSLIYHEGADLTAYGLFPLDATLMFKVVASATMYLIILVQFDKK